MSKNKYKNPIGEVVRVVFWDHASGVFEPVRCELIGKLWSVKKNHIVITTWDSYFQDDS